MKNISLFEPNITNLEKKMVLKSLEKNQISTHGYFTSLFEKEAKKITKSKYNLAVNSGSSGLLVALKTLGIQKNEIVITQSYTFAATTNAIMLNGVRIDFKSNSDITIIFSLFFMFCFADLRTLSKMVRK